ncbi:MAG: hypothetical protein K0R73_745 [Candidatus Midichloriaceae bacterium]|jgi:mitochondrial fission protein ELM1|nr:hypothetical protein [Candidatus Midichloriaceae bacterium]
MKVWVLTDNKIGSSKQGLALAELIGYSYERKAISYTTWAKFPNFIPFLDRLILDKKSRKLLSKKESPDIVIGSGRRLARVSSYLKGKYPKAKFIHILKPDLPLKTFDAIILPYHDKIRLTPLDNKKKIIRVNGAIVNLNNDEIAEAEKEWAHTFAHLPKPKIALLIGGSARGCKMEAKHALELAQQTIDLAKKLNASILVSDSRRTDESLSSLIFEEIRNSGIQHFIYSSKSAEKNPYKGFLVCADYIVVTGDSISMCIESVYMKKPVIIYSPKAMVSKKHWRFIEQLVFDGQVNLLKNLNVNNIITPSNKDEDLKKKLFKLLGHQV